MSLQNSAQKFFEQGIENFVSHDFDKSIDAFTKTIERDNHHKLAYASRGASYMRLNQLKKAIADFDRVLKLDPAYGRAYHLRGLAYEKLGDRSRALEDFDQAIELDPEYGAAYYSRATLQVKFGNTAKASEDIEMVNHLTSKNIQEFASDNNVWRSEHLRVEHMYDDEIDR